MVLYHCKKCGNKFKYKSRYDSHLNRKTPCKIIKDKVQETINEELQEQNIKKKPEPVVSESIVKEQFIKKKKELTTKIKKLEPNNNLKMIDLCAGTGAFTYAFESTKLVDVVFANDMEQTSKTVYDLNFNHQLTLGNICEIDVKTIPKHNILTAGFPCQPFSIAGKQKGFDDPRSNVFWKIIEIVKHHKPECVILENVKNLKSHDEGETFKTIVKSLEKEKYHVIHKILNTSDITEVPQHRERIYIVCVKDKKILDHFNLDFNKVTKKPITDMLSKENINDKYYYNNMDNKIHKMVKDTVIDKNSVYQFRRVYVRKNQNNECPTLTANMGSGGHNVPLILDNKGPRKLTPRECFNFQGFPQTYQLPDISDSKLYKLAGNAVSVPVVKLIADSLVNFLIK